MRTVLEILSREIKNQKSRFVFPSETAAALWARKTYLFTGERSAALNRFLAWDRFKEGVVRSEMQDKQPVSSVVRKLFTDDLIRKNAQAAASPGGAFFRSIIPPEYAGGGRVFSASIAALLPSLGFWEARRQDTDHAPDDEDRDFMLLKNEYTRFLARSMLFEPSWERPPLGDKEHGYYIFFPEAMEDFTEYASLLSSEPSIRIIPLETEDAPRQLYCFDSARAEIRSAVLQIRRFHEEDGIPYEDMAVSMPGLAEAEPCLLRELALYNIPVRRRAGKPLGEFGTGKLFSLISSCASSSFSFDSLKSLLLNEQLPWRFPQWNRELINFGIDNNCVSPYREQGRRVDIWLEAFRNSPREERLYQYYRTLKENLSAMTSARSFSEIRRRYFAFRGSPWEKGLTFPAGYFPGFLSPDACSLEGDAVLARCVEELSALIGLETDYPDLLPGSPFDFFLSLLGEKQYVPQEECSGVNIFPYRVAAAAPFACHLVLHASQNAATVLYQPLKFLRQDKRKRLQVTDTDASAVFFSLYWGYGKTPQDGGARSRLWISASERTFSGWAIPHSFFSNPAAPPPAPADPFLEERDWWAAGAGAAGFPSRLFPVQREGFERWSGVLRETRHGGYQFLREPVPENAAFAEPLRKQIRELQTRRMDPPADGGRGETRRLVKVSATDLRDFFFCPAYWLCKKLWGITTFTPGAKLLDDASLGNLYHDILRNLFDRIRAEDRCFLPRRLDQYCQWAETYAQEAARQHPAFQGPLAVPLLVSLSKAIARKLRGLLKVDAACFAGYSVADLESPEELIQGEILLNGRIDRVSISPDSIPVIIDYKTGAPPSKKDSTLTDSAIRDFQMPMYIRLYEARTKQQVEGAFFFSIHQQDFNAVIGSLGGKRGQSREEYQPTLDALDGYIKDFHAALRALNFAPPQIRITDCAGCTYKNICRTAFSLNSREAPREDSHAR